MDKYFLINMATQRTRLRRICAELICVFAQIYVVKKAYNRRKFAVKPSQRRYFAPIFALFFNISINRRKFAVKPSQRRYFATILRQKFFCAKRAPALAYRGICVEFTRIFCSVLVFFAQYLVHFLLGRRAPAAFFPLT